MVASFFHYWTLMAMTIKIIVQNIAYAENAGL